MASNISQDRSSPSVAFVSQKGYIPNTDVRNVKEGRLNATKASHLVGNVSD